MKSHRVTLLLSILAMSIFAAHASAQLKDLQIATPVPNVVVGTTPTPSPTGSPPPFAQPHAPRKPIPLRWKLAGAGGALLVSLAVLYFASRAWRKWNLFDRQYRFASVEKIALRLGGTRSGGCMATLDFRRDEE